MKLIVITRPGFFDGEAEAINALLDAGLERLHIRKPGSTEAEVEALLQAIPEHHRCRIALHEHFDLAVRYRLGGIHLNRRCPFPPTRYEGRVSRSCHSLNELDQWRSVSDYLFLSPIFDSISKAGYRSAFTMDTLQTAALRGTIDGKVVALGGVDADNIRQLRDMGFGGAAVLGDVWQQDERMLVPHFLRLLHEAADPPTVLTIAGSDCSGGAGIQADIKAISALGGYAASVATALTVQNTRGVQAVYPCDAAAVGQQLSAVLSDLPVRAVKIGMVPDSAVLGSILDALSQVPSVPVVYDPVMVSTSGRALMADDVVDEVRRRLFPRCTLITPNLNEAARLGHPAQSPEEMDTAARAMAGEYGTSVLLKGGHLQGNTMVDVLCHEGADYRFYAPRIATSNLHGTGCTLSSAIATGLARGEALYEAVGNAKDYVSRAILAGREMTFGHGNGPLWHFFR